MIIRRQQPIVLLALTASWLLLVGLLGGCGEDIVIRDASCTCSGTVNGEGYDVECGETFCARNVEFSCPGGGGGIRETGAACTGSSCTPFTASCTSGGECCEQGA